MQIFKDLKYGIQNLITWFPIIWNDRQWDWVDILIILRKKLTLMERSFRKYGHHVHADRDADRMKKCILLMDRLIKDDYVENAYKHHYEKWGDPKLDFKKDPEHKNCSIVDFTAENAITPEEKRQERKDKLRVITKPADMKRQDIDMLFTLIRKHLDSWWD